MWLLDTVKSRSLSERKQSETAGPSSSSTASTLRSLYPRAARALLQRDVALTHMLIVSAFSLLASPAALVLDKLDTHRRKWDILRITLETTVFASPPASADPEALPPPLRANLMLSAQSLVATLHTRSVRLFTPQSSAPKAAYLPAQILVVLVLSSLKLHCPDVGRSMIEDWLAQRETVEKVRDDVEGYRRVVELFCLHVLPRLQNWEYAQEFLEYEHELPPQLRQHLRLSLEALRKQEIEAARSIPTPPPPSVPGSPVSSASSPARSPSPAQSTSSSSSADTNDTHSTRTVVPGTPRPKHGINGFLPLTPKGAGNGHAARGRRASPPDSILNSVSRADSDAATSQRAAARHLIRASLRPLLARLSASQIVFALLFVLVPVFSFILRRRRRRMSGAALAGGGAGGGVDEVRRSLALRAGEQRTGALGAMWRGLARAVADAVRMAGGGFV